jgi:hypothetical protein
MFSRSLGVHRKKPRREFFSLDSCRGKGWIKFTELFTASLRSRFFIENECIDEVRDGELATGKMENKFCGTFQLNYRYTLVHQEAILRKPSQSLSSHHHSRSFQLTGGNEGTQKSTINIDSKALATLAELNLVSKPVISRFPSPCSAINESNPGTCLPKLLFFLCCPQFVTIGGNYTRRNRFSFNSPRVSIHSDGR